MKRGPYRLRLTREAEADLLHLIDVLAERDVDAAVLAEATITEAFAFLRRFPFACRKARDVAGGPFLREMVISLGRAGYVALFQIDDSETVTASAVRHQREDDYH